MDQRTTSERTSITLPPALAGRLNRAARLSRKSVSAIVREALEQYFERTDDMAELPAFAGLGDSGHSDTSDRTEELLAERFRVPDHDR